MAKIDLRLTPVPAKRPTAGYLAVGFGVASIISSGLVFVPLALAFSLAALLLGQVRWAFFGLLLSILGVLTSPMLLLFVGLPTLHLLLHHFHDSLPAFLGATEV